MFKNMLKINYKGNDYDVSQDFINAIFTAKVNRTATISKNVRERADGSMGDIVNLAIEHGIIKMDAGLKLLTSKDKSFKSEQKKVLISALQEKKVMGQPTKGEPTEQDFADALDKVLKGGGQNDF
jgi:hypothetical protein